MSVRIADRGFADVQQIAPLMRRIRMRVTLRDALVSIETLLDLLHKQGEPLTGDRSALRQQGIGLPASDQQRAVNCGAVGSANCNAEREQELLQGVVLVAQLLDRVEVGMRQGLFSFPIGLEASEAELGGHRLCEVSE